MKKQMISNRCRLYLNDAQMTSAIKTLGSCRYIYNLYLDVWDTHTDIQVKACHTIPAVII
jgi:hypothetical protein